MENSINSGDPGYRVYVGHADSKEARWWKAILAPGQGWRSIIRTSSDATYLAPWSLEYDGDPRFSIETSNTMLCADNTANISPPSSEEALGYLTSYCVLHDLGTQYFAALSAIPSGVKTSGSTSTSNAVKATEDLHFLEPCPDQRTSIAATRSIFAWLPIGGEGWGESERSIYEHPWMTGLIPSDTDESASDESWEANCSDSKTI
jgi:hypothetical protein